MKFRIKYFFLFVFIPTVFFAGCKKDKFAIKTGEVLKDNKVEKTEWAELEELLKLPEVQEDYSDLLAKDKSVDCLKLQDFLQKNQGKKRNSSALTILQSCDSEPEQTYSVNVFIENSGSMHGYMTGKSSFEAAVMGFLVEADYHYKKQMRYFYINEDTFAINKSLEDFVNEMEPEEVKKYGNTSSSNLNNIFKQILKATDRNEVSILVSDCIYSISGLDTEKLLEHEKALTQKAFLDKQDFEISTMVIKIRSDFDGIYWFWDKSHGKESGIHLKQKRPFYIWVIGSNEAMSHFYEKMNFNKLKELDGYDNMYIMSKTGSGLPDYYTVLQIYERKGKFAPDKEMIIGDAIHGICNIDPFTRNKKNEFHFAIAVDFGDLKLDETYLSDASNYLIQSEDAFQIKILKKEEVRFEGMDKTRMTGKNFSHVLLLSTEKMLAPKQILKVKLLKQMPQWVAESNTTDDTNIEGNETQTLGISYLIEGVNNAYKTRYPEEDSYISFEVSLKK